MRWFKCCLIFSNSNWSVAIIVIISPSSKNIKFLICSVKFWNISCKIKAVRESWKNCCLMNYEYYHLPKEYSTRFISLGRSCYTVIHTFSLEKILIKISFRLHQIWRLQSKGNKNRIWLVLCFLLYCHCKCLNFWYFKWNNA